ncbi:calcineurin-binding protein [Ophiostoma piceae UAMH 11346]|uniref:Calcineurin-binding protein n=1 Tax=Ophiostoma piceae (strain UAMH 11346) TaxID=1262450 RepID=S3C3P1_OPHP1|nr:calcineurin-binding protein [Ophiostoma piceae UAMH 11346]
MDSAPAAPAAAAPSRSSNLTLDLSSLPAFKSPSPAPPPPVPTNTLLFTNLDHADIFRPDNLDIIRDLVSQSATIHSWAPLKSFRRIIASFYSAEDAARVRAVWDGESLLGATCQVYFGRATPIDVDPSKVAHLELPDAGKLFFISPPPSPPHDWEMRLEDAPNKQVHAEDLADALARLRHQADEEVDVVMRSPDSEAPSPSTANANTSATATAVPEIIFKKRSRSSTLVIYQPVDHNERAGLPAIAVEDMTDINTDEELNQATWASSSSSPTSSISQQPITLTHTARPPVELMQDA